MAQPLTHDSPTGAPARIRKIELPWLILAALLLSTLLAAFQSSRQFQTANELRFLKEAYRFFILNYVVKNGSYFFSEQYAQKMQAEAFDIYLPSVDRDFDPEKLIQALKIKE